MLISKVTVDEINTALINLQKQIETLQKQLNNLLKKGD